MLHHLGKDQRHIWEKVDNMPCPLHFYIILWGMWSSANDGSTVGYRILSRMTAAFSQMSRILFRTFQGIGGSGIYSMVMVVIPEMVPMPKIAAYSSFVSMVFALAYLLGPLLGGVINTNRAWRWIFLLK